jgi:hypothetical protein
MVTEAEPLKLRTLSVLALIALVPAEAAMCTALSVTGDEPYSFEKRRRSRVPPIET